MTVPVPAVMRAPLVLVATTSPATKPAAAAAPTMLPMTRKLWPCCKTWPPMLVAVWAPEGCEEDELVVFDSPVKVLFFWWMTAVATSEPTLAVTVMVNSPEMLLGWRPLSCALPSIPVRTVKEESPPTLAPAPPDPVLMLKRTAAPATGLWFLSST